MLSQLVETFAATFPAEQLERLLRETGRALGETLLAGRPASGALRSRVTLASRLLNEQLGALTHVEKNGRLVIRGVSCPLSALTGKQPAVCLAMESLVSAVVASAFTSVAFARGVLRCCFKLGNGRL